MKNKIRLVIIPARLESRRYPNKLIQVIEGKTLLQRSFESAEKSRLADDVIIAVANKELFDLAQSFGAEALLIDDDNIVNGTERVAIAAKMLGLEERDILINCQADTFGEDVGMVIDDLIEKVENQNEGLFTPCMLLKIEDYVNENVVKVNNNYDTFSRGIEYKKHIGIYAAKKKYFDMYLEKPQTYLEVRNRLEQLRFFLFTTIGFKEYNKFLKVYDVNAYEDIVVYNNRGNIDE